MKNIPKLLFRRWISFKLIDYYLFPVFRKYRYVYHQYLKYRRIKIFFWSLKLKLYLVVGQERTLSLYLLRIYSNEKRVPFIREDRREEQVDTGRMIGNIVNSLEAKYQEHYMNTIILFMVFYGSFKVCLVLQQCIVPQYQSF